MTVLGASTWVTFDRAASGGARNGKVVPNDSALCLHSAPAWRRELGVVRHPYPDLSPSPQSRGYV
jgi:hypothetical protein